MTLKRTAASKRNAFPRFLSSNAMEKYIGAQLREKIENPLKFQWLSPSAQSSVEVFDYDVTVLASCLLQTIEIQCNSIGKGGH
jgi:hypothetical protein